MDPTHLGWVELSDHAEARIREADVPASLVIGRVQNLHGICYEDTDEGGYNLHCPGLNDLVMAFEVQYHTGYDNKQAVVKTVFECDDPYGRFLASDRFEEFSSTP